MNGAALARMLVPSRPRSFEAETTHLRGLVHRVYVRHLVERGFIRPIRVRFDDEDTSVEDESDVVPEVRTGLPNREDWTAEDDAEVAAWLSRVVLVDARRGVRVRVADLEDEPKTAARVPPSSPAEVGGARTASPATPPPAGPERATSTPANDREETTMAEKQLTPRQHAIVDGIARGETSTEIAKKLGCRPESVRVQASRLRARGAIASPPRRKGRSKPTGDYLEPGEAQRFIDEPPARSDDPALAALRVQLEQLDARRARILAAIAALEAT